MAKTAQLSRVFRVEADAIAGEVRQDLGLDPADPLPALLLAEHVEIPVLPLSTLLVDADPALEGTVAYLRDVEPSAFSAATISAGAARVIVVNDVHTPARQASSIAHEVAHGLLMHSPAPITDAFGCRMWDGRQEREADWLGAVLLVPAVAALRVARSGWSDREGGRVYGVSEELMRWRMNMTAARKRTGFSAA